MSERPKRSSTAAESNWIVPRHGDGLVLNRWTQSAAFEGGKNGFLHRLHQCFATGAAWLLLLTATATAHAAAPALPKLDDTPRVAIVSAFEPEWKALVGSVENPNTYEDHGLRMVTGTLAKHPVVMLMSGMSMVNAAMNTQAALDRFHVTQIVVSGIAGGVDPELGIGDVVVPAQWAQPLESVFARESEGGYHPALADERPDLPNFGMIFPKNVQAGNAHEKAAFHLWFQADPGLLALAQRASVNVPLKSCVEQGRCLDRQPKIVVGGAGVTSPAFVDNKAYREYLSGTFHARVLDMESGAIAQVAYANEIPFIAFRSLSDLAGGDAHANQMWTFLNLAAINSAAAVTAFVALLPPNP
jgi:adenosylhomocysteine nucleosidase